MTTSHNAFQTILAHLLLGLLLALGTPMASAEVLYVHTDHLNTPRLMTNEQGTTVWRLAPTGEPFGTSPAEEDPDGDSTTTTLNQRFPGQYNDRETNLHYNDQRDGYDPGTGRYTQTDPLGLYGGDLSLYLYAKNNPLSYIDPLGLSPGTAAGAAIGTAIAPGPGTAIGALIGTGVQALIGGAAIAAIMSTPGDSPATGALPISEVGDGKWKVLTGCNVNKFGPSCDSCPDRVFGYGYGRDFLDAKKNGEIAANMQLKGLTGCQKRHCEPKACWVNGNPVRCPNFK